MTNRSEAEGTGRVVLLMDPEPDAVGLDFKEGRVTLTSGWVHVHGDAGRRASWPAHRVVRVEWDENDAVVP